MSKSPTFPDWVDRSRLAAVVVLRACGESQDSIAKALRVSQSTVSRNIAEARRAAARLKDRAAFVSWAAEVVRVVG